MDAMAPLLIGSIKALLLLLVASGAALTLQRRSARLRAVVWSIALAGCLAIPVIAPLLPTWSVPLPAGLARLAQSEETSQPVARVNMSAVVSHQKSTPVNTALAGPSSPAKQDTSLPWHTLILTIWAAGAAILLARLGFGLWRVAVAVRQARQVTDPGWLRHLDQARERIGCRRSVRLLVSDRIEIPATTGVIRPAIVLPLRADTWLDDRRRAVLLHELVHVLRFDWPARMVARITRAAYWFNPLAWWAVRRLDLEQELACDEEVLALGTGASDYACHLLGIARHALPTPAPSIPALGMARTTHLEERIMTILKRTTHRRVGIAVIIPAAILMAAMVPALASVYPGDPAPRQASPEIKELLAEMEEAEKKIEPQLKKIEEFEIQIEPTIAGLEEIEITIDDAKIAEIEARMQPFLERLENLEIDMAPYEEQLEALEEQLENMDFHIEDGTLGEIERQIREQMSLHMSQIESIHVDMEPFIEEMEKIHLEMEGFHENMVDVHVDMEPIHAQIEKMELEMAPFHEQMEQLHLELEPFTEEMERIGDRLEKAIQDEVAAYLRSELGAVTSPSAPIDEAASRIIDHADINVHGGVLKIKGDEPEIREILTDLMLPHRIGTQDVFDQALDNAATGLSPMVIQVD